MFEIIKCDDNVRIKYSNSHKKHFLIGASAFCSLLLFGSIFMLVLHYLEDVSILISIFCAVMFFCAVIVIWVRYADMRKFDFIIDGSGIKFHTKKEKYVAGWEEINNYGIIKNVGSQSMDDTLLEVKYQKSSDYAWMYNKNTMYFSKSESPNFKKVIYHIQTNFLLDHGIFKGVCCISEGRGEQQFFCIIKEAVARFCTNDELTLSIWDATGR